MYLTIKTKSNKHEVEINPTITVKKRVEHVNPKIDGKITRVD
jgi:hypothetical protein